MGIASIVMALNIVLSDLRDHLNLHELCSGRAQASTGMHGKIMDGRALVVRLRSEGPRPGGGGGGGGERPRGFAPGENDESKARPGGPFMERALECYHLRCSWIISE